MKLSNNMINLVNEAKAIATGNKNKTVAIQHVYMAAVQHFKSSANNKLARLASGAVMDRFYKKSEEVVNQLPKITDEQLARYKGSFEASLSREITQIIDTASMIASEPSGWQTGEIEISHMWMAILPFDGMTGNSCVSTFGMRNCEKILAYLVEEEAIEKGLPVPKVSFSMGSLQNPDSAPHGEMETETETSDFYYNMLEKVEKDDRPFIGREKEVQNLLNCLARMDKPNAILVGEPGVGKTDVVRGLAKMIVGHRVPENLGNVTLFYLDVPALLAGAVYRGQFEERLKNTIKEIMLAEKPIIFIDEIHMVIGAGNNGKGGMDAANILKPYLTDGKLGVIGATTNKEYREFIESDSAFMRRFQKIDVNEPTAKETIQILKGIKKKYEDFHHVKVANVAIENAVHLSVKHMHDRFLPDKAIDILDQSCARVKLAGGTSLNADEIAKTVSDLCKIPVETITTSEKKKYREIGKKIKTRVFGQDEAIEKLSEAIQLSKAGLSDPNKPIGSFFFVGPSGVGKTEVAKQLADSLGIELIRFDMSEYADQTSINKFIGSSAGYVGYEDGGLLVEAVRQNPHAVILFDEFEKAHPSVFKIFLQILDYGMLSDNKGRKADFRNTVIIMTSNAGSTSVVPKQIGFGKEVGVGATKETAMDAVKELVPPEFRGRLTDIVCFNKLSDEMVNKIIKKTLDECLAKVKAAGIKASYGDDVIEALAKEGISPEYGARGVQRVVENRISRLFLKKLLSDSSADKAECRVIVKDGEYVLKDMPKNKLIISVTTPVAAEE